MNGCNWVCFWAWTYQTTPRRICFGRVAAVPRAVLERGEIPFHKIGTHRRVRYQDPVAYKERIDVKRSKALDALAEQGQVLKMGMNEWAQWPPSTENGRRFNSAFGN